MDYNTHLICETAQYMTLDAWPIMYGEDNKYDLDSRDVLMLIREWAEEFENWWQLHDDDWMDSADYQIEVEKFAIRKAKEFVSSRQ